MIKIKTKVQEITLDCLPDKKDSRDYIFLIQNESVESIPSVIDNRSQIVKIMNQSPEGACVGHAICLAAEYLYSKKTGNPVDLSQRWIYRKTRENDDFPGENYEGTSTRDGLKTWLKFGICREEFWPWIPYEVNSNSLDYNLVLHENQNYNKKGDIDAKKFPLLSYSNCLRPFDIKYSIYKYGIVVVRAEVHSGWNIWDGNEEILWDNTCIHWGGHAFVLVGYDEVKKKYLVANSWGERWGNKGFAYMDYKDFNFNGGCVWNVIIPG